MLLAAADGGVGAVKLLDFGIAKIRAEQVVGESSITGFETTAPADKPMPELKPMPGPVRGGALATSVGSVMGTPAYMAPEQVQNSSGVDKRADIYAIGIMLYEALVGRRPFEAESSAELMGAHMYMKAELPSKEVQKLRLPDRQLDWAKLDPVVMRALAKKPEERYQDCAGLQADLESAWGQSFSIARGATLSGGSSTMIPALPVAPIQPKSSSKLLAMLAAAVMLVVLAGGGAYFALARGGKQQAAQAQLLRADGLIRKSWAGGPADKRAVLEIFRAVGSRAQIPLVAEALADDDPAVSRAALQVVQAVGKPGDTSLEEPLQVLAGQAVGSASVDIAAARLRIGDGEAQSDLSAMLHSPIPTAEARLRAAVVLASAGHLPAPALRQSLEAAVRAGLNQPAMRREALVWLAAARDAVALRQLQEATEQPATGPTKDTHLEALQILTLANQPGAAERLRKVALSVLPVERVELAAVLAEVTDAQAVALLTPLLSDPQSKVRQRALAALGRLACRGQWPGSTDVLIPLLNDADAQVALTAAVSLVAASAAAASQAEASQK